MIDNLYTLPVRARRFHCHIARKDIGLARNALNDLDDLDDTHVDVAHPAARWLADELPLLAIFDPRAAGVPAW